ncbi:MAG: hypothetical protein ACYDBQ_08615 [Thermoplasmatota archaeon]
MTAMLEAKRQLIASSANAESLFLDPDQATLYTNPELHELAQTFRMRDVLERLGPVQLSHEVKRAFIRHLGYPAPTRFRGVGRERKPKFMAQLMDIFVQTSTNLQVWNYLPYDELKVPGLPAPFADTRFIDCRYVVIPVVGGIVRPSRLVTGRELGDLDRTKVRTIKYQATLPPQVRGATGVSILTRHDPERLQLLGGTLDGRRLRARLAPLIGAVLPAGTDRQVGQHFHGTVAAVLGVTNAQFDDGQFPDLPELRCEVKFQTSPTIDLGMHVPNSNHPVRAGLTPAEVTYIIGYGAVGPHGAVVQGIAVALGQEFDRFFPVWNSLNSKVQIPIPRSWF